MQWIISCQMFLSFNMMNLKNYFSRPFSMSISTLWTTILMILLDLLSIKLSEASQQCNLGLKLFSMESGKVSRQNFNSEIIWKIKLLINHFRRFVLPSHLFNALKLVNGWKARKADVAEGKNFYWLDKTISINQIIQSKLVCI